MGRWARASWSEEGEGALPPSTPGQGTSPLDPSDWFGAKGALARPSGWLGPARPGSHQTKPMGSKGLPLAGVQGAAPPGLAHPAMIALRSRSGAPMPRSGSMLDPVPRISTVP